MTEAAIHPRRAIKAFGPVTMPRQPRDKALRDRISGFYATTANGPLPGKDWNGTGPRGGIGVDHNMAEKARMSPPDTLIPLFTEKGAPTLDRASLSACAFAATIIYRVGVLTIT